MPVAGALSLSLGIEIISTPRNVSYEDCAILSQKPYVAEESEAPRDMLMGLGMI